MNDQGAHADPDEPIAFIRQFIDIKIRQQGGVATYYDNHLRRLIPFSRGLPSQTPAEEEELLGDADHAYEELTRFAALAAQLRFQNPVPRLERDLKDVVAQMAVSLPTYEAGQGVLTAIYWAGMPLFKSVYDLAAYPMLIAELQPRTIIELGSGSGASAIWLADVASAHGLSPQIISVDLRRVDATDSRVTFLNGDIADLEGLLSPYIASLQHPWLIIEDAHVYVAEVLTYFDEHMHLGDYMIIEDSTQKREALLQFVSTAPARYLLDTRYVDLFGHNTTCAVDSIFRRV